MELTEKRPALFLDRDGVINVEKNYLYKKEDFEFIDSIFELCKFYQSKNYLIIVVTNQSGIARGYYSEADFSNLTFWMVNEFEKNGVQIDQVYHCPHHPDISGKCTCRKPEAGMLLQASKDLHVDLKNSVMIGDKERDIQAALNAGLKETYLFTNLHVETKATKIINNLKDLIC